MKNARCNHLLASMVTVNHVASYIKIPKNNRKTLKLSKANYFCGHLCRWIWPVPRFPMWQGLKILVKGTITDYFMLTLLDWWKWMVREKIVGPEARNVFLGGQPSFWVALKRAEYFRLFKFILSLRKFQWNFHFQTQILMFDLKRLGLLPVSR